MNRWEYLVVTEDTLERLDELGAEGWELVTFLPRVEMWTQVGIFKRAVASA